MKRKVYIGGLTIIFFILISSCSIQNRMTKGSILKTLKTLSSEHKGNLLFENDYAIMYFQKDKILGLMQKERKSKLINSCNLHRLESYIEMLQKTNGQIIIFKELSVPSDTTNHFEIDLQRHLIEKFSLNSKVSLYNKKTNTYERSFLYKKRGGDWGCCFAELAFSNGDKFLDTRLMSSVILIEECDN